jgi:dTMP kinase
MSGINMLGLTSALKSKRLAGQGAFIVVEGFDGSGKSTVVSYLNDRLLDIGKKCVLVKDFATTPVALACREIVMTNQLSPESELLLIQAARHDIFSKVIQPNLDKGEWVICDRWVPSSFAYQGAGKKLGDWWVNRICDVLSPADILIHVDTTLEESMRRVFARTTQDLFERQPLDVQHTVWSAYRETNLRNKFSRNWIDVNGNTLEAMHRDVNQIVAEIAATL